MHTTHTRLWAWRGMFAAVLLLCGVGRAEAATVKFILPTAEAKPGQEFDVPVAVKGVKGMTSLQMLLTFDPAVLEVVKGDDPDKTYSKGNILPTGVTLGVYPDHPGIVTILLFCNVDEVKKEIRAFEQDDGVLVTVRFRVIGQPGQKTALGIEKAQAFQLNDMDMLVKVDAGEVTVGAASSAFPWLWIAIGLGVLALLFLFFLMTRRKRAN